MATMCPERVVLLVAVVLCAQTNLVTGQGTSPAILPTSSLMSSPNDTITTNLTTLVQSYPPFTSAANSPISAHLDSSPLSDASTAVSPDSSNKSVTVSPTGSQLNESTASWSASGYSGINTTALSSWSTSESAPTSDAQNSTLSGINTTAVSSWSSSESASTSDAQDSTLSGINTTAVSSWSSSESASTSDAQNSTLNNSMVSFPITSPSISPASSPTTFPVTNGKSPSTSSIAPPKYLGVHGYNVNSVSLNVSLNFTIKFNTPFNPSLHNRSSSAFREAEQNYTAMLTPIFNNTDSFDRVEVTKFWNGSTGVAYTVVIHASGATDLRDILESRLEDNLKNLADVDQDYIDNVFQGEKTTAVEKLQFVEKDLCSADIPCNPFFACETASQGSYITCKSPCEGFSCNEPYGSCELNSAGKPMCRCTSDNRYVYGGDDCSKKGETLKLSSEYIIGIGGGVGGGVVLILVIALIVTCCRRSKTDHETDRKSVESFHSDINDTAHAKDKSGSSTYQDPYNQPYERRYENMRRQDSGLPEQDKFEADFRSPASRAADAAARSDKPSYSLQDGRLQREANEVTVYSPEASPFFQNQAYESFPEPGHFTAGEVYPPRGVQRPFLRQPSDGYNPLIHSTAYPSEASASRPKGEEEASSRLNPLTSHAGKWSYEASAPKPKPVSRDNYGFEDRTRYVPEPRLDRPSAGVPIPYLRPPADVDANTRIRGQIFDYTAGPRKA